MDKIPVWSVRSVSKYRLHIYGLLYKGPVELQRDQLHTTTDNSPWEINSEILK